MSYRSHVHVPVLPLLPAMLSAERHTREAESRADSARERAQDHLCSRHDGELSGSLRVGQPLPLRTCTFSEEQFSILLQVPTGPFYRTSVTSRLTPPGHKCFLMVRSVSSASLYPHHSRVPDCRELLCGLKCVGFATLIAVQHRAEHKLWTERPEFSSKPLGNVILSYFTYCASVSSSAQSE